MLIDAVFPFGIPIVLCEFLCGNPAAATRGIMAIDLWLYKTGIVDRPIGPFEGGVVDPALVLSLLTAPPFALDIPDPAADDATDGAEELNDFGSGKAEGRTVCTDIIFV